MICMRSIFVFKIYIKLTLKIWGQSPRLARLMINRFNGHQLKSFHDTAQTNQPSFSPVLFSAVPNISCPLNNNHK